MSSLEDIEAYLDRRMYEFLGVHEPDNLKRIIEEERNKMEDFIIITDDEIKITFSFSDVDPCFKKYCLYSFLERLYEGLEEVIVFDQ